MVCCMASSAAHAGLRLHTLLVAMHTGYGQVPPCTKQQLHSVVAEMSACTEADHSFCSQKSTE